MTTIKTGLIYTSNTSGGTQGPDVSVSKGVYVYRPNISEQSGVTYVIGGIGDQAPALSIGPLNQPNGLEINLSGRQTTFVDITNMNQIRVLSSPFSGALIYFGYD